MEKEIVYITSKRELKESIREVLAEESGKNHQPDFEKEKLTRSEAAKLAGVSLPTLTKMIKKGMFPLHGMGRKQFLLRSEIIAGLRKNITE